MLQLRKREIAFDAAPLTHSNVPRTKSVSDLLLPLLSHEDLLDVMTSTILSLDATCTEAAGYGH